jgi:flagellin
MSLVVNFNGGAIDAHRNLLSTDKALQSSIAHLSSGLRVATAADDPAGLVISESLRAQADGLGQAIRNANDGVNMIKTAEGALNEVNSLLRQMRTLAVHAANSGVNSADDIAADQAAVDAAVASIDRISASTQFNGKLLLDGSFSGQTFQVGAYSSDTVSVDINAVDTGTLGVDALDLSGDAAGAIDALDTAIASVSSDRADLGAIQKYTLDTTVNSLSVAEENVRSSESAIRDVDMAAEMVNFTRNNIMMQAGTAMLAQANAAPQSVLQLLR